MRKRLSSELKLSLKITLAITVVMIFVFIGFTFLMRNSLTKDKSREIKNAAREIEYSLEENNFSVEDIGLEFLDIPYYIDFSLFRINPDSAETEILYSNNSIIPVLPETNQKVVRYLSKNYFSDGSLDVLYFTKKVTSDLVIQVVIDIESDSASQLIYSMPEIIPVLLLPIMILSFLILYFFIKKDVEMENRFSANVSHELQTPVTAILGHAQLLQRWGKSDPNQLETSIKVIISEAISMRSTISNLLEMTKLEKKITEPHLGQIQIEDFFDAIKNELKYENRLTITREFEIDEDEVPEFVSDRDLLHQVFIIAISNSLKYCGESCQVKLKCIKTKKKTVFEITDNGKGFSKEILPYVFDRFYRGDEAHSRSKGGAGLGLSIAKSISEVLGLKITAYNNENGGAGIRLVSLN